MLTIALDGFVDLRDRCPSAVAGKVGGASNRGLWRTLYLEFADEHPGGL